MNKQLEYFGFDVLTACKFTDVLEERTDFIFRVEGYGKQQTDKNTLSAPFLQVLCLVYS
jgi:hypothetical protein